MSGLNCRRFARLLIVSLLLTACRGNTPVAAPPEPSVQKNGDGVLIEMPQKARDAIALRTMPASYGILTQRLQTTAVIKPDEYRLSHVSPRIGGKAVKVEAKLGDNVKAGQTLAELDSIELGDRKAAYLTARANYDVARRNYDRESKLYKQEISSEKEYLDARGDFERDEASFNAAREALRLLNIPDREIENLQWSKSSRDPLSYFPLVSPFTGTVIARHITLGEMVRPDATPFTIADLSTVWVIVDVYEKDLGGVTVGDSAKVLVDSYPNEVFRGKVTYLNNVVDEATRTAPARVQIPNEDGRLRPGMFATVTLALHPAKSRESVLIPAGAVQQVSGKNVAFVEQRPGTYAVRDLTLGDRSQEQVQVRSGVAQGDLVVTTGGFYLKSMLLKQELGGD